MSEIPRWSQDHPLEVIKSLQSELTDLRKENEELKSEIKSLEWSEKCLAEQVTALKSELIKKEAEAGEMREALKYVQNYWYKKHVINGKDYIEMGCVHQVINKAIHALSLDVGKDFLKRYEAMRDVIEAARQLKSELFNESFTKEKGIHKTIDLDEALSALDAIRAEEKA